VRSCVEEGLRADDCCAGAVGGGTALELCEGWMDHGAVEDLFEGVLLLKLGVGVPLGVFVGDAGYLGEVFCFCAISGGSCQ